jgi:sec-independent protein translocase protein TatC
MPNDKDLFEEEQQMVAMSFGDHIEELRTRLILALLGLAVGVVLTFVPPLNLGMHVMRQMQDPAQQALDVFYKDRAKARATQAAGDPKNEDDDVRTQMRIRIPAEHFAGGIREIFPSLPDPPAGALQGKFVTLPMQLKNAELIQTISTNIEQKNALISLAPLESITIFFMVCMVTGLVIASPWVFYHLWAFVAAGLYRHERRYVKKLLPFSLGLFLGGVFLCYFGVLPVTLGFLLSFNVWLGIEPTLRISEWMSFATILPLVFGIAFQTPLVMLFLERIGVFTVEDYRSKRKFAILIMFITAAVLTPGPDVFSQLMLAVPMIALYELGHPAGPPQDADARGRLMDHPIEMSAGP